MAPGHQSCNTAAHVGPPLDGTRNYQRCFCNRGCNYCKCTYKHMTDETLGDICASSLTTLAYQEKVVQLRETKSLCLNSTDHTVTFNETEHGECFFRVFDTMCCRHMFATGWGSNNYNRTIISLQTLDDYIHCTEWLFWRLWTQLCLLHDVAGNHHKEKKINIPQRKCQFLIWLFLSKRNAQFSKFEVVVVDTGYP